MPSNHHHQDDHCDDGDDHDDNDDGDDGDDDNDAGADPQCLALIINQ